MNGLTITTTETGFALSIPWKVWLAKIGLFRRWELTEEALRIFEEGEREYREGKTEDFRVFIKREYPQYAHHLDKKG